MSVSDNKHCALLALTGKISGDIDDMEQLYLEAETGVENATWDEFWDFKGVPPGAFNDRADVWLTSLGFVGSLDGKWYLLWEEICDNGTAPLPFPPSAITDFAATDNQPGQVTMTWTNATGDPVPTYDLHNVAGLVATGVASGYVHTTAEGTDTYHVEAINSEGTTDSNTDSGTSLPPLDPPSDITDFAASDDAIGAVTSTFTPATGNPTPTHDLYDSGGVLATGIASGHVYNVAAGTEAYHIKAINSQATVDSNVDNGTSLPPLTIPSAITDFVASDNAIGEVTMTWTDATGNPTPTYDLYDSVGLIAPSVSSGYVYTVTTGTDSYYVKAVNSEGGTDSNTDDGVSLPPLTAPSLITDFTATDDGISSVTMTWSNATGNPVPTYDVYNVAGLIEAGVDSGYVFPVAASTDTYHVKAVNSEGTTDSNTDSGTALPGPFPPSSITDFAATDDQIGQVVMTWSDATGNPVPTYDLHNAAGLVSAGVASGYTHTVAAGTDTYHVKAINTEGIVDSNTDDGTSLPPLSIPTVITDFVATNDQIGQVTVTFSDATGNPTPTYDLWNVAGVLTVGIASGYVYAVSEGTDDYHVEAVNSEGSAASNTDEGASLPGLTLPSTITDFAATDGVVGSIAMTWTDATGNPTPTHDLHNSGGLVTADVSSGYVYSIVDDTDDYFVQAINSEGSVDSNTDSGTSLPQNVAPSPIADFNATDDVIGSIIMTWSDATGNPVPTYDLHNVAGLVSALVSSGYVHTIVDNTDTYHVKAANAAGVVDSNTDSGTSLPPLTIPSAIDDFAATDDVIGSITMTWSDAVGNPTPTYDLYDSVGLVTAGVSSGHVHTIVDDTDTYLVRAINSEGGTNSNADSGTSLPPLTIPSAITDFNATDDVMGSITMTWTDATGNPTPTYDLHDSAGLVAAGVSSGYVHTIVDDTDTYFVQAINSEGSVDSNTDSGTSLPVPAPPIFAGDYQPPDGVAGIAYGPYDTTQFFTTGGVVDTYSMGPGIPPGMTFVDGILGGTPSAAGTVTDSQVTGTNADGSDVTNTSTYVITLPPQTPILTEFYTGPVGCGGAIGGVDIDSDGLPDTVLLGTVGGGDPTVTVDADSINVDLDGDGVADVIIPI